MGHFHFHHNDADEILTLPILDGKVEKFSNKAINLRQFYIELHDQLVNLGFKDMLGEPSKQKKGEFLEGWAKAGELPDQKANQNRTADMFEKDFLWSKALDGAVEVEIKWSAFLKTPYSKYGWVEFTLNLVSRRIQDIELLEKNQKKTLQKGTWEFRNKIIYKNSINPNFLSKIPFIKNSKNLKQLTLDTLFLKPLEEDFHFCIHDVHSAIYSIINKHFSTFQSGHH